MRDLTRRQAIGFALAGLATSAGASRSARGPTLEYAIARAGGAEALGRVQALSWQGRARIHAGTNVIEIGVSTRVVPFRSARSESWLPTQDRPSSSRTMIVEEGQGWLERGGTRSPMPAAMLAHEQQQYAIYGVMLLVPLRGRLISWRRDEAGRAVLGVRRRPAPDTDLVFDRESRLVEARNRVSDPEGGAETIDQIFRFSGEIVSNGVRWPRRIEILQRGQPYFTLEIERFEAEA